MNVIISDTSPINYLVLIGQIELLKELYGKIIIPPAVFQELNNPKTPEVVKKWVEARPFWLEIKETDSIIDQSLQHLDPGEREAITLAKELNADALIIDEEKGRAEAQRQGIPVIGTLRLLSDAAGLGLCDLEEVFEELRITSFRASPRLYQYFLKLYEDHHRST